MKRILTTFLVLAIALMMVGCHGKEVVQNSIANTESADQELEEETKQEETVDDVYNATSKEPIAPFMIPVDMEKLPEDIKESDIEDGYISAHRLMELTKELGKEISLVGTDGRTYFATNNMLLSQNTEIAMVEEVKTENEVDENKEEPPVEEEKVEEPAVENTTNNSSTTQNNSTQNTQSNNTQTATNNTTQSQPKVEESKPNNSSTNTQTSSQPKQEEPKNNSSTSQQTTPSQPKHEHSWTAVYKTVNHPAEYKTVHHDAEYKTVHHDAVYETQSVAYTDYEWYNIWVCTCGYTTTDQSDYQNHCTNSWLSICPETGGKTFDEAMITDWDLFVKYFKCGEGGCQDGQREVTKYRDEQVCVKEAYDEKVLVKAAYDEKVLVKEAWTEEVIDYYKCSCGAKK